jgi:hypothetical protein
LAERQNVGQEGFWSIGRSEAGNRFVIIRYYSEAAFDEFWNGGGKAWIEKYAPQARSVRVEASNRISQREAAGCTSGGLASRPRSAADKPAVASQEGPPQCC